MKIEDLWMSLRSVLFKIDPPKACLQYSIFNRKYSIFKGEESLCKAQKGIAR